MMYGSQLLISIGYVGRREISLVIRDKEDKVMFKRIMKTITNIVFIENLILLSNVLQELNNLNLHFA